MATESGGDEWAHPGQEFTIIIEQLIVYYLFTMSPWLYFKLNEGSNNGSIHQNQV